MLAESILYFLYEVFGETKVPAAIALIRGIVRQGRNLAYAEHIRFYPQ